MSSPVVRTVRDLTVSIASLADTTLGTFDFPHPDTPDPAVRGTVQTLGLGSQQTPLEGGSNSLPPSQAGDPSTTDLESHGGLVSLNVVGPAGLIAANVFLRALRLIDKDGNVLQTIYADSSVLPGVFPTNSAITDGLLRGIPVKNGEGVRVELYNNSGGALTNATLAARYELGLNVQVADLSGQVPTI